MKPLKDIPDEWFQTNHEKALAKLSVLDKKAFTVGMHTANMNVNGTLKKVILPPMNVYIDEEAITDRGVVSSHVEYRVTYNHQPFPLAHIYSGQGHLCLGNIPVPPYVSPYQLMTPLETLLLYNDRYLSHGNPKLTISKETHRQIQEFMLKTGYMLEDELNGQKYLEKDVIWELTAHLLTHYSNQVAYAYEQADELFQMIFRKEGI